jgi:hypothetical protein
MGKQKWIPLVGMFTIVTLVGLLAKDWLQSAGVAVNVLLGGNGLLFAASMLSFLMYQRAMHTDKPFGFVNRVYAGFMVKFFILIIGVMLYFFLAKEVNKPAVFICMGLYLVYNFLGTSQVVKKQRASR